MKEWISLVVAASVCVDVAYASDLAALMKAKSTLEFELARTKRDEVAVFEVECRRELAGTDLPRSCFKMMRARAESPPSWLDRVCERRVRDAARVETLRDVSALSERCRASADERREDLEYRIEVEEPVRLLDRIL